MDGPFSLLVQHGLAKALGSRNGLRGGRSACRNHTVAGRTLLERLEELMFACVFSTTAGLKSDITRATKAVREAGLEIARVEVAQGGVIIVVPRSPAATNQDEQTPEELRKLL